MKKFFEKVIKYRVPLLIIFVGMCILSLLCAPMVSVNYDMNDYLPKDTASTVALDVMGEEFDGGIPNARVMIRDVTVPEALEYKEKLGAIDGVTDVTWLDDAVNIYEPLEMLDEKEVEAYYKDNAALFSVTIDEEKSISAVEKIRDLIGDDNAMTGSTVSQAISTATSGEEVAKVMVVAIIFLLLVLAFTTTSWLEPLLVLAGLGIAVVINMGTNVIFGEISFVSNAAGSILQMAVSLDYSIFLLNRFDECRKEMEPKEAMREALYKSVGSILSSGLTTIIGFFALVLMQFQIGPDLGLVLAKGVTISLITVFLFMPGLILATYKWLDKTRHRSFLPGFRGFGKVVSKITVPLMCVFLLLIVPSYLSSTSNDYYYGSAYIYGEGTQLGEDAEAINEIFGESDTYVLLVEKGNEATEKELCAALKELPEVDSIMSYVETVGSEIPYEYLDESTLEMLESEHYSRIVLSMDVEEEGEAAFNLVEQVRDIAEKYYPGKYHLAGAGVSTYDLKNTITSDMIKVNLIAIVAIFIVLLFNMKSVILPFILVLTIETAIWINFSIPYYMDSVLFYMAYLIISSIQLGATVDYAILFADRYKENSRLLGGKECMVQTLADVSPSILTSGTILTVVGFLLGGFSTHGIIAQIGTLLGKGTLCSMIAVLFVLPGFLYVYYGILKKRKRPNVSQ